MLDLVIYFEWGLFPTIIFAIVFFPFAVLVIRYMQYPDESMNPFVGKLMGFLMIVLFLGFWMSTTLVFVVHGISGGKLLGNPDKLK